MLILIASIVLPVLITAAVGFVWTRRGHKLESADLTALIADVATPCLVVSTFQSTQLPFEAFTAMAGAAGAAILGFAALGFVLLRLAGLRMRTFLPSIAFPNAGNLGLPLSLYAFGPEGLGYAIAFFSISSVANYTLGQAIAAGQANWRGLVRLPLLYAVALGIGLSYFGIELPTPIAKTVALIGNLTVPLMLLMLGASLSRMKIRSFGRAALVSAFRIGGGALIGLAVAALFDMSGSMKAVLIMQASNPVAVYNYLFAQRWNNEPEEVAGVVVLSTVISIATIPLLLGWLASVP
jgi:predicted permease